MPTSQSMSVSNFAPNQMSFMVFLNVKLKYGFCLYRFCMVYSEVPNFSEPNPELLSQPNQQNKSVSSQHVTNKRISPDKVLPAPPF